MPRLLVFTVILACAASAAAQQPASPALDYDFFKARIQPVFTTKRAGNARCVSCHSSGTPMRLQPLAPGAATWSEEDSRKNFELVKSRVIAGKPEISRLLRHPLAESAGGDPHHDGGKHWTTKDDPEWQTLAAWVRGATLRSGTPAAGTAVRTAVRIIQTNSAGDNVHIIDPATNKVVGQITGIEVGHGAAAAPDGSRLYISNEADTTLDMVDGRTLRVAAKIPLSGHPNNIAASRDGTRVYVAIRQAPGAVDVVDTASLQRVKSIPIKGDVHNTYVTPDGRFVVAGSIAGKNLTVIDQRTEEPVWTLDFELGVRPMAFDQNADGSTRRIFVQLSDLNGFAVVDFATRKEVTRINLPQIAAGKKPVMEGGNSSHGLAVTADNRLLVVNSRLNSAVYVYSLPDLKLAGAVDVGIAPDWVTLTPDGRSAYVANAGSNSVSVVDLTAMREVVRIPVGQVPKRNITATLPY
ncbi:MAG TPA: cytochrome D1 domain-containing protein [Vicinamibacterales bacterium]|jgi:YVTN family beta-propeller protein|nr:cytochrome D1 domain-containing protein [Vicinamibacterales bacterium]